MLPIIEPIFAGIIVSLINKYVLNANSSIWTMCSPQEIIIEHEDNISSSNTAISDSSFDAPHVHVH